MNINAQDIIIRCAEDPCQLQTAAASGDLSATLITAGTGLAGALIGGLATWLTTRSNDKRNQAATDRRQWDAEIRKSYTTLSGLTRIFTTVHLVKLSDDEAVRELQQSMSQALMEIKQLIAVITPITTDEHVEDMNELEEVCWKNFVMVRDRKSLNLDREGVQERLKKVLTSTRSAIRLV